METIELLAIANYALNKGRGLVPYSSNRPDVKNQPFHRIFWLTAMRTRNDRNGDRHKVMRWHPDLSADKVKDSYRYQRVTESFSGFNGFYPTLLDWYKHLETLPQRDKKTHHKDGTPFTTNEVVESVAKNAVKFGIGNCKELACVGFNLLLEYPKEGIPKLSLPPLKEKIFIEIAYLPGSGGDHGFVIMNRKPSKLNDMSKWNVDTIIVDLWMGEVIVLADHIGKKSKSNCFNYLWHHQKHMTFEIVGYLGEGHSKRWQKKHADLSFWKPVYDINYPSENMPWNEAKEDDSPSNSSALKKQKIPKTP